MEPLFSNFCSLKGRDIWVVGGAGYLGQATVRLLVAAGANVLCADLDARAAEFIESARLSSQVSPATLDVRNEAAIKEFVENSIQQRGVPTGLVNLTYASTARKLEELTGAEFDEVNHGGLTATFLLARTVGKEMARLGRGSIVLFSSMYGSVSPDPALYEAPMNKNPIEYGVGKAGIIQMTRYLAVHWGRQNVRCNCVSPGPFPNPTVKQQYPEFIDRLAAKVPLGRVGQSSEAAGPVLFLLSEASSYITGHNLPVDGGWTSW